VVLVNVLELDAFRQGVSDFERGHYDRLCLELLNMSVEQELSVVL
jgi:hypothetical protein